MEAVQMVSDGGRTDHDLDNLSFSGTGLFFVNILVPSSFLHLSLRSLICSLETLWHGKSLLMYIS